MSATVTAGSHGLATGWWVAPAGTGHAWHAWATKGSRSGYAETQADAERDARQALKDLS